MATVDGNIIDLISKEDGRVGEGTKGRFLVWLGYDGTLGGAAPKTNYKMQAVDPTETSGYATWLNTTGDDTGKPGTATGVSVRIASWPSTA